MEENENKIKELNSWDFSDTFQKPCGYNWESVPEATSANIVILMDKINELIRIINTLNSEIDH